MKKQLIVLASLVTVVGVGASLSSSPLVSAQSVATKPATSSSRSTKIHPRIRRARFDAKLNQAVRDNTITAAQKTSFVTEAKLLRTERKAAISKSSTTTQRQAERTKLKSELQAWATSNNFPLSKIFPKLAS